MFQDVGKELKTRARTVVIMTTLKYTLIGGGAILVLLIMAGSVDVMLSLVAAVIAGVAGYSAGREKAIILYSYGELVDRVISIERKVSGSCDKGLANKKKEQEERLTPVSYAERKDAPVSTRNADGSWNCLFCDHRNPANAKWCEKCNVEVNFE